MCFMGYHVFDLREWMAYVSQPFLAIGCPAADVGNIYLAWNH